MVGILSMISKGSFLIFAITSVFMIYYWFHHDILNVYREIKGINTKYTDENNKQMKGKSSSSTQTIQGFNSVTTDDLETKLITEEDETIILAETTVLEKEETACLAKDDETTVCMNSSTDDETVLSASGDETVCFYDNQDETVLMKQQDDENVQIIEEVIMIHTDENIE